MIRLLIADDHAIFREGLKHILAECPDVKIADEAKNGNEVLDKIWNAKYDMVLLDISMPGMSGIEVTREMLKLDPEAKVVFLSADVDVMDAALEAGAVAFLKKPASLKDIVGTVEDAVAGTLPEKK
jgi:DNA-binding NarL/FixJ family response regulator